MQENPMTTHTTPQQDNLLGICHALGETFGFNPLYLRLALLPPLVIVPQFTLLAYAAAGVAVLASKLLVRSRTKRAVNVLVSA
jgi:phage shock protein PspC (stress-responsive transcriptional regulator)